MKFRFGVVTATVAVAVLAMLGGCKKKQADTIATPASAPVPVASALQLAPASLLKPNVAAMPQLASAPTAAMQQINATLKSWDKVALDALSDCKTFTKTVQPTMLGPAYVSVWVNEQSDCGAYPNTSIYVLVFDLNTGNTVDWTKLVSGAKSYADTGADGKNGAPQAVLSPALTAAYTKWDSTQDGWSDCQGTFDENTSFIVWPEAKGGVLKVEPFDFPHAVQACANDFTLTLDQAKTLGFDAGFLNAVGAAHQQPGAAALAATPQ